MNVLSFNPLLFGMPSNHQPKTKSSRPSGKETVKQLLTGYVKEKKTVFASQSKAEIWKSLWTKSSNLNKGLDPNKRLTECELSEIMAEVGNEDLNAADIREGNWQPDSYG